MESSVHQSFYELLISQVPDPSEETIFNWALNQKASSSGDNEEWERYLILENGHLVFVPPHSFGGGFQQGKVC